MVELAQARGADINIIDIRRVGRIDGDPGP
jgi:hypothetical protein